ncbi:hypothetical protein NQ318_009386 [Aromia moschata]|uniref:Uncharacterized protein n=1 Tax=Aromia moschata TaxID=1265417 RepID=A0AAV8ZA03_9CUCU|nr:hypothetical protein NQ318_009386 [Aromia moschata]
MPYYSDLGLSGIPSSSVYSSLFLPGPYSNHSSIIASNFSHSKPLPRHFRGGYKPHLSTISELRRINSPNLYHTSPKVNLHPIKRINTADIDVSVNKYKKYEKYEKPKTEHVEKKTPEQTPSPKRSPRASLEDKEPSREARPNPNIRRDRATVRLHTVHNDTLQREIGAVRSWRDNFKPEELDGKFEDTSSAPKKMRKTPGQILKEKFLIRSRSKENMLKPESKRLSRKRSVRKSPSFHDICEAITSDNIDEDLNPGQPTEVQRRQTRQLSGDRILKEIRRTSTNLSEDDLQILDAILAEQNDSKNESETAIDDEGVFESRGSVRKKKAIRKKSNDNLTLEDRPSTVRKSHSREKLDENEAKLALKRRSTKKRLRPSTNLSRDSLTEKNIERTAFKPKPVITGSGDIEETKPSLKAVVDEIQVKEAPTPKKEKKFRFNVIVEVDEEVSTNKSTASPTKKTEKFSFSNDNKGTVQLPKARSPIITSILKKRPLSHNGQVIQQKRKKRQNRATSKRH